MVFTTNLNGFEVLCSEHGNERGIWIAEEGTGTLSLSKKDGMAVLTLEANGKKLDLTLDIQKTSWGICGVMEAYVAVQRDGELRKEKEFVYSPEKCVATFSDLEHFALIRTKSDEKMWDENAFYKLFTHLSKLGVYKLKGDTE